MAALAWLVDLLARWLMPELPWVCRAKVYAFWVDGLWKGGALGGGLSFVCLLLARLFIRMGCWLFWLIRKKDRR